MPRRTPIGWSKFTTNQKHNPDLGTDTSSVWNLNLFLNLVCLGRWAKRVTHTNDHSRWRSRACTPSLNSEEKETPRSLLRHHFAGKPVVVSRNVNCFSRLEKSTLDSGWTLVDPYSIIHDLSLIPDCFGFLINDTLFQTRTLFYYKILNIQSSKRYNNSSS